MNIAPPLPFPRVDHSLASGPHCVAGTVGQARVRPRRAHSKRRAREADAASSWTVRPLRTLHRGGTVVAGT